MGKISICEKCCSLQCSGRLYNVEGWGSYGQRFEQVVCESETYMNGGKRLFKLVCGHGDVSILEAVPIDE